MSSHSIRHVDIQTYKIYRFQESINVCKHYGLRKHIRGRHWLISSLFRYQAISCTNINILSTGLDVPPNKTPPPPTPPPPQFPERTIKMNSHQKRIRITYHIVPKSSQFGNTSKSVIRTVGLSTKIESFSNHKVLVFCVKRHTIYARHCPCQSCKSCVTMCVHNTWLQCIVTVQASTCKGTTDPEGYSMWCICFR